MTDLKFTFNEINRIGNLLNPQLSCIELNHCHSRLRCFVEAHNSNECILLSPPSTVIRRLTANRSVKYYTVNKDERNIILDKHALLYDRDDYKQLCKHLKTITYIKLSNSSEQLF